jgi:dihydrofolate reductase
LRIAQDNPTAAVSMGDRLVEKSLLLGAFPQMGAIFTELGRDDVRELAVPPYRLIYRVQIELERVTVLVAWHGARQEPHFGAAELNERGSPYGTKQMFTAIAAMSLNRVIGNGNMIPWHLPEDFKWFKQVTMGQMLVMGRKTFESIGKPLPGRETIVLTRGAWSHPGVTVIHDLNELVGWSARAARSPGFSRFPGARENSEPAKAGTPNEGKLTVFIAGGAEIYRQALPLCSELLLTLVKREVEGDAFFPPFEEQFELVEKIRETPEFDILRFRRHLPAHP